MSHPRTEGDADIDILLDGELVARVLLDGVQDAFPWYGGTLVEGPALARWRDFVDAYHRADLELDYCPHHPDEGPYEESDLARYVDALTSLHAAPGAGASEDDPWLAPWIAADPARLRDYVAFLDWRRWRAVDREGQLIQGIPLPPSLDFESRRFAFRP